MSEHGHERHCIDCGGSGGHHFNDCIYDGENSGRGYSSNTSDTAKWIVLVASVIFMGLCPPLGVVLFTILLFM